MDSTISSAISLLALSKTLTSSSSKPVISNLNRQFNESLTKRFCSNSSKIIKCGGEIQRFNELLSLSSCSGKLIRSCYIRRNSRLACISSSASSFSSYSGGGDGNIGAGGGGDGNGGGGGSSEGEIGAKSVVAGVEEISSLSPEVIVLDVGGMTCGGCAGKVKRILENQPQVASCTVNLATETAIVWPVPELKETENWQQVIGETLAKHLTNCGFNSNLRGQGAIEAEIVS